MKQFTIIALTILVITGCGSRAKKITSHNDNPPEQITPSQSDSTSSDLFKCTWQLTYCHSFNLDSLNGQHPKPQLTFESEPSRVSGTSGCNGFIAQYTIQRDSLLIGVPMATKKYCKDVPEREFFEALQAVNCYKLSNDTLNLFRHHQLLLTFTKQLNN